MKLRTWKVLAIGLVAPLSLALLAQPTIADHQTKKHKVKKIIKCEDGECTETVEDLGDGENIEIVIGGDDGESVTKRVQIRKMRCDGEECEEHEGHHNMVFVGDDGEVEIMAGGGGHAWVSHHGGHHGGGFLGVGLTELTSELREHFGVSADSGVMVSKVVDDSPAFKAGLAVGDIITGVDGESVSSGSALAGIIRGHEEGDEVVLNVWRDGASQSITAAVEEREQRVLMGDMGTLHERIGGMHKKMRKIKIECDDDDSECGTKIDLAGIGDFDCGADECKVQVECDDSACSCTVNGEETDCEGIPGVSSSNE